jgi:hypothetical protein
VGVEELGLKGLAELLANDPALEERRAVHIAMPLRSQYTMRIRSRRIVKKMNKCPLSGSCRRTSRTSAIRLSGPFRPGSVA